MTALVRTATHDVEKTMLDEQARPLVVIVEALDETTMFADVERFRTRPNVADELN